MKERAVHDTLREFFADAFGDRPLADDDDIFAMGFGNSLLAMQLVEFLETTFAIEIDGDDLEMENFRTIAAVAALVGRKRSTAVPASEAVARG